MATIEFTHPVTKDLIPVELPACSTCGSTEVACVRVSARSPFGWHPPRIDAIAKRLDAAFAAHVGGDPVPSSATEEVR